MKGFKSDSHKLNQRISLVAIWSRNGKAVSVQCRDSALQWYFATAKIILHWSKGILGDKENYEISQG